MSIEHSAAHWKMLHDDAHAALEATLDKQAKMSAAYDAILADREQAFDAIRALLANTKPHATWTNTMLIDKGVVNEVALEYAGLFMLRTGDHGIHHEEGDVGQYQLDVIALAMTHGWDGHAEGSRGLTDDYWAAFEWLNDGNTMVPEGFRWGWYEQMFGIWMDDSVEVNA